MDFPANQKRIITGAVLGIIPILAIAFQGWVLFTILAAFCVLAQWEFYDLFSPRPLMTEYKAGAVVFTFLLLASFMNGNPVWPVLTFLMAFWAAGMNFLVRFSRTPEQTDFRNTLIFLAGLIYIPLNFHFFLKFNQAELFLVLLAATVTDTAAYYVGTALGKRKIWPAVSPKKSWAGSFGGLTACVLMTVLMGSAFGSAPFWAWVLLGIALNIAAQMGDFFESALKRTLDVKDSSRMLPGHGGLLDRVDSLLLVVPVYALLRTIHPFFG